MNNVEKIVYSEFEKKLKKTQIFSEMEDFDSFVLSNRRAKKLLEEFDFKLVIKKEYKDDEFYSFDFQLYRKNRFIKMIYCYPEYLEDTVIALEIAELISDLIIDFALNYSDLSLEDHFLLEKKKYPKFDNTTIMKRALFHFKMLKALDMSYEELFKFNKSIEEL